MDEMGKAIIHIVTHTHINYMFIFMNVLWNDVFLQKNIAQRIFF